MRVSAMRDIGGCLSPFNAFLIQTGIGTLHVRMQRHIENAKKLAAYLKTNKFVEWVNYNGLEDNKNYKMFIEKVRLALHVSNLGDIKTIVTHPASTTHRQIPQDELESTGITANLIRVSVGIENIDDIIEDFKNALED